MDPVIIGSIIIICLCMFIAAAKSAYRCGVHDGWRAAKRPEDPLWNSQRKIVREYEISDED